MIKPPPDSHLNENQQRRFRVTCEHIDTVLAEIEAALNEPASEAAFPVYLSDISEEQQREVERYIALVRAQLIQALQAHEIPPNPPFIPLSRAIQSRLCTIDIAAEEIRPRHMRGYGAVSATTAEELSRFADDMQERANGLQLTLGNAATGTGGSQKIKRHAGRRERDDMQ